MEASELQDILGKQIPNALKAFKDLESSLSPILDQVNANRDKMSPEHAAEFDKAMEGIKTAKQQMREYGNNNK